MKLPSTPPSLKKKKKQGGSGLGVVTLISSERKESGVKRMKKTTDRVHKACHSLAPHHRINTTKKKQATFSNDSISSLVFTADEWNMYSASRKVISVQAGH